jgi:hypothetical protein
VTYAESMTSAAVTVSISTSSGPQPTPVAFVNNIDKPPKMAKKGKKQAQPGDDSDFEITPVETSQTYNQDEDGNGIVFDENLTLPIWAD